LEHANPHSEVNVIVDQVHVTVGEREPHVDVEEFGKEAKATVIQVLVLAGIVLGTVVAKGALAAERGLNNVPAGAGFQSNQLGGFDCLLRAPVLPPPVFNQSNPYTVPQSPALKPDDPSGG
jgi:hypothetical protein